MERLPIALSILEFLKSAVAVVAVFVVCIVIHEFGHYIVAKRCGVAVPAFAIGFGPKLVRWMRRGTEFSIRLFPIGGLVQLAGEMPQDSLFRLGEDIAYRVNSEQELTVIADPADLPGAPVGTLRNLDLMHKMQMTLETAEGTRTYRVMPHAKLMTNARNSMPIVERHEQVLGKPLYQRAAMILAGPVMNFILAGILFSLAFMHMGVPSKSPVIGGILTGSAAQSAGLRPGDKVVEVNGTPISNWTDLVKQIQIDKSVPLRPLVMDVERAGQLVQVSVTPRMTAAHTPQLGIDQSVTFNPGLAIVDGFQSVYTNTVNALQSYGQVIHYHRFNDLSGPVGIADVISQQAQTGIWQVIAIAGFLSLNLGLFNLLPIPALDGGRLLFMFVELLRGKSVDPRKEGLVHLVGFGLLMLFAVVITFRDVTRLF
jgi:regulator of sigma E protease